MSLTLDKAAAASENNSEVQRDACNVSDIAYTGTHPGSQS